MAPGEDRWDVFLAHASPDKPRARTLHQALTALGLKVFLDEESLLPGDDWMDDIPAALRASDVVVVLVSASTAKARYEGEELVIALSRQREGTQRVVPVHLEPDVEDPYGTARLNREMWLDEADLDTLVGRLLRVIPGAVERRATGASIFCHRIPVPPRHFTGREELLERLATGLGTGRTTILTQTIQGMGGVGKTTVAAALCEEQRTFHDIVWWVRAEDQGTLVADLAALATEVGATTGQGGDADADAVIHWLEEVSHRRWLVVYDNVPDRDSIGRWLPKRGRGAAIITSRYKHMDDLGAVEPVDLLPDAVAEAFLHDRVSRPLDEDLEPVLERVRGLPLALEQAAAWVDRKPNRSFTRWVQLYDDAAGSAFALGLVDYEHTAATTWRVSIDAATEQSPLAEPLLGALGFFAPEDIVLQWLRNAADDPFLDASPDEVDSAIDALDDYDLLTITADDTVDIHRIIHDVARRSAPDGAGPFAARALIAQDPGSDDHEVLPQLRRLAPHARRAGDVLDIVDRSEQEGIVTLLCRVAHGARFDGQLQEALDTATFAAAAARAHCPGTVQALMADDASARAHGTLGKVERAITLLEEAVSSGKELLGGEDERTLALSNNLATAYLQNDDPRRAIPILTEVLEVRERITGLDHPWTLTTRANLASALTMGGQTGRAISLQRAILEARERILGPDHPHTLTSVNNLASAHHANGDTQIAIDLTERALASRASVLGPLHPDTLQSRHNLGVALCTIHAVSRGLPLLERVHAERTDVLGPDHPDTLRTARNLARARTLASTDG